MEEVFNGVVSSKSLILRLFGGVTVTVPLDGTAAVAAGGDGEGDEGVEVGEGVVGGVEVGGRIGGGGEGAVGGVVEGGSVVVGVDGGEGDEGDFGGIVGNIGGV